MGDDIADFQTSGQYEYPGIVVELGTQMMKAQVLAGKGEEHKLWDQASQDQAVLPVCPIG